MTLLRPALHAGCTGAHRSCDQPGGPGPCPVYLAGILGEGPGSPVQAKLFQEALTPGVLRDWEQAGKPYPTATRHTDSGRPGMSWTGPAISRPVNHARAGPSQAAAVRFDAASSARNAHAAAQSHPAARTPRPHSSRSSSRRFTPGQAPVPCFPGEAVPRPAPSGIKRSLNTPEVPTRSCVLSACCISAYLCTDLYVTNSFWSVGPGCAPDGACPGAARAGTVSVRGSPCGRLPRRPRPAG